MSKVRMYHPDAGTLECSPRAAKVHAKAGWIPADGVSGVTVPAADGKPLTSGTVFPPETFDDLADPGDDPGPRADTPNPKGANR